MVKDTNVPAEDAKQPEETVNDTVEETTEDIPEENLDETSAELLDDEEETEEDDEEAEVEEEEPEEEPKNKPTEQRPVYTMPVSKAQKEKKRAVEKAKKEVEEALRAEYEAKIAELQSSFQAKSDDYEQEIEKFAEEEGLESGIVKKIVEFAQKPISSKLSKIDELMAEKEKEANFAKISQEFDSEVASLIQKDYPTATPKHIAEVKKKIMELAFTPEYHTYKLSDIYKVNKEDFAYKDNYSVEPSEGGTVKVIDFKNMTPQEEHKLAQEDPEKFEKYIKFQEAQHSSYIDI